MAGNPDGLRIAATIVDDLPEAPTFSLWKELVRRHNFPWSEKHVVHWMCPRGLFVRPTKLTPNQGAPNVWITRQVDQWVREKMIKALEGSDELPKGETEIDALTREQQP